MATRRKYRDRVDAATVAAPAPAATDAPAAGATPPEPEPNPLVEQLRLLKAAERTVEDRINELPITEAKKKFLRSRPHYAVDPALEEPARIAYKDALKAGVADDTPEMFAAIERGVEQILRGDGAATADLPAQATSAAADVEKHATRAPPKTPPPARRSPMVSAPVSRTIPGGTIRPGEINLTPEQREAARISGVDDFTYAKGLKELTRRKSLGMYQDKG